MIRPDSTEPSSSSVHRVGDSIPASGIYRVTHADHRIAHDLTLLAGELFPRCNKCGEDVTFELVAAATTGALDPDFRIRLYEIPHPDLTEDLQKIA